jgi:tetratricopeptide (TPR) repeat protein
MLLLVLSCVMLLSCGNDGAWALSQQDPEGAARGALREGRYEDAISAFRALTGRDGGGSVAARRGLVYALSAVGRYDEAETAARTFVSVGDVQLQRALGDVLRHRGKLDDAAAAYAAAVRGGASDSLLARVSAAELLLAGGDRAGAMREFDHFIDVWNDRRPSLSSEELMAVAIACRHLGADNPELFKDALKAFDAAIAKEPEALAPRVGAAELFLEKYNLADARSAIDEVLQVNPRHPDALRASAKRQYAEGEPGTMESVRAVLAVNPGHVPARSMLAQLLLDTEDYAGAAAQADSALAINPASSEALAMRGAVQSLRGDDAGFAATRRQALAVRPHDASFFATLGEVSARNRHYRRAQEFAAEGVALDSSSWHAWGVLGENQLRNGEIAAGRASLERAFAGDPYTVRVKNTLDLLDTFDGYREVTSGRFLMMAEAKDANLLALYVAPLGEEAYDSLVARYGIRPEPPIRIEFFRSHADFSVRTVGLAGLGALGVSFGTTLAMDSPAARAKGEFNWGSTFWHELAHTFTLGASEHEVPRWFSEGLSVLEERRAREGWGANVTLDFLAAWKGDLLVPVSRMNDGFMRPAYPQQVIHSYYQASLVCEMIEREFGANALTDMLLAWRDGLTTAQVFARVLQLEPAELDKRFATWMDERFGARRDAVEPARLRRDADDARTGRLEVPAGKYVAALERATRTLQAGDTAAAIQEFDAAREIFPEYAGEASPYRALAAISVARGDEPAAIAALRTVVNSDETSYEAHRLLATLLEQQGDSAGAARVLERAMYIWPFDLGDHQRLAGLLAATGNTQAVVRERRAVVALAPTDRAEAYYQLAKALLDAGDRTQARREVLRALEEAPSFRQAQDLLLTLQGGTPTPPGGGIR